MTLSGSRIGDKYRVVVVNGTGSVGFVLSLSKCTTLLPYAATPTKNVCLLLYGHLPM